MRSSRKSLITNGTKNQRRALALFIERGMEVAETFGEFLTENHELDPRVSAPIMYHGFSPFFQVNCYYLNAIGYAVMGLEGDFPILIAAYREQLMRARVTKLSKERQPYAAAADMLGLPTELLWEVEFLASFGYMIPGVLDELRCD